MATNSVIPQVGDKVRRGQVVAAVDNVGFSTGSHLHFQAGSNAASILIRFAGIKITGDDVSAQTCFTPTGGDNLISTNVQP
jgi:murein DD-endopeptidase MepM/ murein hydrolase activator NlpD